MRNFVQVSLTVKRFCGLFNHANRGQRGIITTSEAVYKKQELCRGAGSIMSKVSVEIQKADDSRNHYMIANRRAFLGFGPLVFPTREGISYYYLKQTFSEWVVYIAAALVSSGILLWIFKNNIFVVSAAKPIYDYESTDKPEGRGGSDKTNIFGSKVKKSKRERYNFIAEVVEAVADSVVCIEVKDHASIDWVTGVPQTASNGSGFIVREDGLILTNAHVVAGRQKSSIAVRLSDGRSFAAHIEDIDYESDLATIRINAKKLPVMPLGCSADSKIGEWVVALGSPLSLANTITAGVISSVSRGASELGIRNDINYIQTDAAITFGNSGGPLINLDGEAIGINSMKVTAGISFAIPIDYAKRFLASADANRSSGKTKATKRYMGITILTVTDQIRFELQARGGYGKISNGVLVWQVVVGSPAYLAGIQPGDIITHINQKPIMSSSDLYEAARTTDKLQVNVQRGEKVYSCVVTPEVIVQS